MVAVGFAVHKLRPPGKELHQAGAEEMYIREIARNLYKLKRRLEELEQAYEVELPGAKRDELERELYKARVEYHKVKNILEGAKESS